MKDKGYIILMVVVMVLLVALFAISYFRRKRYNSDLNTMRNDLKIGDKVMTDTGVVGELVDTYEEEGYKYFVLKSGKGSNVGYFAVHANAIYYVFGKENEKKENTSAKVKSIVDQPIVTEQAETMVEETETKIDGETEKPSKNETKKRK